MTDVTSDSFETYRTSAIRYWERRRIAYNLALIPPALLSYAFTSALAHAGDDFQWQGGFVLSLFAVSAVGANICYSFAYALEFLYGFPTSAKRRFKYERTSAFAAGLVLSIILALIGGREIALMEYFKR